MGKWVFPPDKAGRGIARQSRAGILHPPFSFPAGKENPPEGLLAATRLTLAGRARSKRKVLLESNFTPLGQSWTDGSWWLDVPPSPEIFCRVRYTRYFVGADAYIGPCFPAFVGVGAGSGWPLQGFQQQAPLPLPRRSRPAAAKRNAGPFSLCPTSQFRFAWRKIEIFSKTGPAPNASGSLDHHGLLLGLPYFKQIRRIQRRFAPKRFFSLDRARPRFSFLRPKKRNGGAFPSGKAGHLPAPPAGGTPHRWSERPTR